jgi:hypothetical protein
MVTIEHDKIKQWISKNKGKPEVIDDPSANGDMVGIRVEFPQAVDNYLKKEEIQETTWEQFFAIFEEQQLAFEYDSEVSSVDPSLSYRFLKREAMNSDYA